MLRLLIADDHTVLRESLAAFLRASGDCLVVAEAGDGIEAIEKAKSLRPHVAILDISMPLMNGIEVTWRLTAEVPCTRVLALTMHQEQEYVWQLVQAGAVGYLVKDAPLTELLDAVRTIAAGRTHFGAYASSVLAAQRFAPRPSRQEPFDALTMRERETLELVVQGLTTKEIARQLRISDKTAENHRCRILSKLGVRNSAEAVRYAVERGLGLSTRQPNS